MMNRWMLALGLAFLSFVPRASRASEAPRFYIRHWDTSDGLPQNTVFTIVQTRDGYLWVGTLDGLARFDGLHFEKFYDANTPGLNSTKIVKLFEDSHTNLWIATENAGIVRVDPAGRLERVEPGPDAVNIHVSTICEDGISTLWFRGLDNGMVYGWHEGKNVVRLGPVQEVAAETTNKIWIQTYASDKEPAKLIGLRLAQKGGRNVGAFEEEIALRANAGTNQLLMASRDGGYWFVNAGRVTKCQSARVLRDCGKLPSSGGTSVLAVSAACEDLEGNLVIGTPDGVFWYKSAGGGVQITSRGVFEFDARGEINSQPISPIGLNHPTVVSLCMDREGSLWVGTDGGGLHRITRQTFDVIEDGRIVKSVCEDSSGTLRVASYGEVIYWENGKRMTNLVTDRIWSSISVLCSGKGGNVWAAGVAGVTNARGEGRRVGPLFELKSGEFHPLSGTGLSSGVSALFFDRAGRLWAGTLEGVACLDGGGWKFFSGGKGLIAHSVDAIAGDSKGTIWCGIDGGGLNQIKEGGLVPYTNSTVLGAITVSGLYVDKEDVVWAGTSGGLVRIQDGKSTRYTISQGLINDHVGYVIEDDSGYLWLGSTAGLTRVRKQELNDFALYGTNEIFFRHYGVPDGLPSAECIMGSQPAAARLRDGRVLFCTIKGIAAVNPSHLHRNTNPPPVRIEQVLVAGELQNSNGLRVLPPSKITIPPRRESLEIHFTSLNLAAPLQGKFRYRMAGYESGWAEKPGNVRFARYPRLPPGDYTFQVRAFNEDNVESASMATLAIRVLPPFWQTMWFRLALSLALIGIVAGSVYYVSTQRLQRQLATMRQQEALERERARIARDLHDQLGANLTQVALLGELAESDKNEPAEVESHARQISQTARETTHALDEIVWTVNPSNDTLDGLINYVCKYAQEYLALAGLRYRIDVPPQLPNSPISPELRHNAFLAAKESINNIVKHSGATSAWLRLELSARGFTMEISDDGKGLSADAETKGRSGLKNMRKRMEDVGGKFEIAPRAGGGTVVRLTAPL